MLKQFKFKNCFKLFQMLKQILKPFAQGFKPINSPPNAILWPQLGFRKGYLKCSDVQMIGQTSFN